MIAQLGSPVAILVQDISCSSVRSVFLFTSFSGFVLCKCLQPSFVVSHLFSWQVLMMGPMCVSLLCLVLLRIMVRPDLDGIGRRSFDEQFKELRDMLLPLGRSVADYESHIQTITNSVPLSFSHPGLPALNRSSKALLPRWPHSQKWNQTSAPSRHAYARWKQAQLLPPVVPGPIARGPLTTNTRRRLDTFSGPEDEHARSAV